jgi:chlorite dismutase
MRNRSILAIIVLTVLAFVQTATAEVEREKLLKETGVYGTFAVFKVGDHWWQMDHDARTGAAAEVKKVFQKHADKIIVDTYLLRGLSEKADFFVRIHSKDTVNNQNFLWT